MSARKFFHPVKPKTKFMTLFEIQQTKSDNIAKNKAFNKVDQQQQKQTRKKINVSFEFKKDDSTSNTQSENNSDTEVYKNKKNMLSSRRYGLPIPMNDPVVKPHIEREKNIQNRMKERIPTVYRFINDIENNPTEEEEEASGTFNVDFFHSHVGKLVDRNNALVQEYMKSKSLEQKENEPSTETQEIEPSTEKQTKKEVAPSTKKQAKKKVAPSTEKQAKKETKLCGAIKQDGKPCRVRTTNERCKKHI